MNNKKPTIAFFGSSLVSAYWNGAATYYRGIIKYLHRLGYHVTFYEPNAYERQQHRDLPDPDWARSVVYENSSLAVAQAVNDAAGADILIKASGVGVFDEFLEKALVEIKKPHQTIIFWDVDAPATLDSVFSGTKTEFRNLIPQYDYVFTYGGGNPVVDAYKSLNVKKCIPIYNAHDPETHFRVPADPAFECDLAFLGNRLPDREERVYQFFIDVASRLPDHKFILGGSGWDRNVLPSNIKYVGHVYTNDHNVFNSTPKAVLNISRQSMADYGFSPATRVFEAAGAGACIITDFWAGVENFFVPGSEIWVAHEGNDVVSLLKWIDQEEAERTGNAALAKVLSEHTYKQRAQQIDDILLGKKTIAANK
jgi:spore maturation protein CgeB